MQNKLFRFAGLISFSALLLTSCSKNDGLTTSELSTAPREVPAAVQQKIADAQANITTRLQGTDLNLVNYEFVKQINTAQEKQDAISEILSANALVPSFDGSTVKSFRLFPLASYPIADKQVFTSEVSKYLQQQVQPGKASLVKVNWTYNGTSFSSLTVVSATDILYDNMFYHISFREEPNESNITRSHTFANFDILWLWGGKRGHVNSQHFIKFSSYGGYYYEASGWGDGWMQMGTAQGRGKAVGSSGGKKSVATLAYAWSTVQASTSFSAGASGTYSGVSYKGEWTGSASGIGSGGSGERFTYLSTYR